MLKASFGKGARRFENQVFLACPKGKPKRTHPQQRPYQNSWWFGARLFGGWGGCLFTLSKNQGLKSPNH